MNAKFFKEFQQYLRNYKYERTDEGILFPQAHVLFKGVFTDSVNNEDALERPNLVTDQGLIYVLDVALHAGSQISNWFVGIGSGSGTPAANWTAANFSANATEITTGYSEATRPAWTPDAIDTGNTLVDNTTVKAAFTIVGAQTVNIAALLSSNVKGGTAGTLFAASKFASTRNLNDGDDYQCTWRLDVNDA